MLQMVELESGEEEKNATFSVMLWIKYSPEEGRLWCGEEICLEAKIDLHVFRRLLRNAQTIYAS